MNVSRCIKAAKDWDGDGDRDGDGDGDTAVISGWPQKPYAEPNHRRVAELAGSRLKPRRNCGRVILFFSQSAEREILVHRPS